MYFNEVIKQGQSLSKWLINIRRDIHQTPELAMEEFITHDKIKKYLNEIGVEYKEFENHRGIMAQIIRNNTLKTIGIRADIDALPIKENNNRTYKSKHDGIMHACGHDAHTAMLLGACKILYEMRDELNINVKFFFQGAEESCGGARYLIGDGCLENPKVDYMFEIGRASCRERVYVLV